MKTNHTQKLPPRNILQRRFDGLLPIVVDVETGGFYAETDALLEIAAYLIEVDAENKFCVGELFHRHVAPFEGARLDAEALRVNHIDPTHPFRYAVPEKQALLELFEFTRVALEKTKCRRAVLVGHNAHFDLGFIQKAYQRCAFEEKSPFHAFTVFDTATLAGLAYGKTVLAKALRVAKIPYSVDEAHSAIYDAKCTAELFCKILNGNFRMPY